MCEPLHRCGLKLLACLAVLAGLAFSAVADRPPYTSTFTYESDLALSGSLADAHKEDGSFAVYTVGGVAGSGYTTAMAALLIKVDHPMRVRVTYTIDYIGGCYTAEFGFCGLSSNWRIDGQNAGARTLVSPFAWDSLLDKTAALVGLLVTAGSSIGALPDLPAGIEAFRRLMKNGTAVVDAMASLVETLKARRETVSFSFDATGSHLVEVGVEAKTGAVGVAAATAMALGVVSEIRVEPELVRVEVQGPPSAGENASADYSCIAYYSDGTHADVTDLASWSINTAGARVNGGLLAVGKLGSDVMGTITADYTWKPTDQTSYTQSASRRVTLAKAPPVLPTDPPVVGQYYDPLDSDNVLEINADGTFYTVSFAYLGLNVGEEGTWHVTGETVTLSFGDRAMRGQVRGGAVLFEPVPIISMTTSVWIRRGKPGPPLAEVAGEYTPTKQGNGRLLLRADGTYELQQEDPFGEYDQEGGRWTLSGFAVQLHPDSTDASEYSGVYAADSVYLPHGLSRLEMLVWRKSGTETAAPTTPASVVPNEPPTNPSAPVPPQKPGPLVCSVELGNDGSPPGSVWMGKKFQIHVTVVSGAPSRVRFSYDDNQDGQPTGSWTSWFGWGPASANVGQDGSYTDDPLQFATGGPKEVWVEIQDAGGQTATSSADIFANFRFVHMSDVHIGDDLRGGDATRRLPAAINELIGMSPKPAFVVITGDLVDCAYRRMNPLSAGLAFAISRYTPSPTNYEALRDLLAGADGIPIYAIPGNHDWYGTLLVTENLGAYKASVGTLRPPDAVSLGDPYGGSVDDYAFQYGGFLFVGLDSGPDTELIRLDGAGLTDSQWNALQNHVDQTTPKIIFMHHPAINTGYPDDSHIIANHRDDFLNYCLSHNVELVLSGHTHESHVFRSEGAEYLDRENSLPVNPSYPLFVITPSVGRDETRLDHPYRVIDVVNGHAYVYPCTAPQPSSYIAVQLDCPADLHVYDSQGHHAGVSDGAIERGIPRAFYIRGSPAPEGDTSGKPVPETVFLFDTTQPYSLVVKGTGAGTYTLTAKRVAESGNSTTFVAKGITTSDGAAHQYSIDWSTVARGEQGVTVRLDSDGNGVFEKTLRAGAELDETAVPAQPSPTPGVQMPILWVGFALGGAGIGAAVVLIVLLVLRLRRAKR